MPITGSAPNKVFSRTDGTRTGSNTWQDARDVDQKIRADAHDTHDQDIAAAINTCWFKDGSSQPTANLPMNSNKFTGLGQGSARTDSISLDQVQDGDLVYAGTVGGTADAIELTMSPTSGGPVEGMTVWFVAGSDNTGATTVDLDGNGAVAVQWLGAALVGGEIKSGQTHSITYDDTQWQLNNPSLLGRLSSTSNGLGAALIGIEDSAGNFTATDVEAALAEILSDLASNSTSLGASLVGIEDSGGIITATTVEAALAEIQGDLDTVEADYLTSSDILDEDDFSTDSATKAPSQQSAKAYAVTIGSIVMWPTATAPTNWLECDGSAVSRTTYSALFSLIGVIYGNGDGSTTFNLPDLRGEFVRGFDNTAGNDPDAASRTDRGDGTTGDNVGTKQDDEFELHGHPARYAPNNDQQANPSGGINLDTSNQTNEPAYTGTPSSTVGEQIGGSGGNETRPRNVAMMFIIRAL